MPGTKKFLFLVIFSLYILFPAEIFAETSFFQQGSSGYTGNWVSYLDRYNPVTNMGTAGSAWLRPENQYPVIRFDLSSLPTNSLVQNAKLKVYVLSSTNANTINTKAYKLIRDWNENEVTWHKANNLTDWYWVGANGVFYDRIDLPADEKLMSASNTSYEFDITPLVREWVVYPETNRGVVLVPESSGNVGYSIASDNNTSLWRRPSLTVDYLVSDSNDLYPIVKITNPTNENFLTGTVNLTADASDDLGIERVDYYLEDSLLGSVDSAPYPFNFDTAGHSVGKHKLRAVAVDGANQISESAIYVYIYRTNNGVLTIGHITDTHVGTPASYEPSDKSSYTQNFQRALADLNSVVKPAVIIHTGDIVTILDNPSGSLARSIINDSVIPVKTIAGNHDNNSENYYYYFGPYNHSFDIGQNRMVGFSTAMLNESFLRGALSSTNNKGIVFSHYLIRLPEGSTEDPNFYQMSENDARTLQNILKDYQAPAYLSGHYHQSFLFEDFVSGAVEIGGPTLSSKGTYRIITSDNGIVSSNEIAIGDWPAIVITSPQRFYTDGGTKEIEGNQKIRAKIYGDANISSVSYKIDDSSYVPMNSLGDNVWEATKDFSGYVSGIHKIYVEASDVSGRTKSTSIDVKIRQISTPTPTPVLTPITVNGSVEVDSSDPLCAGRPSHCALFTIDTGSVNSYASLVIKLPNNLAVMCPTGLTEATKKHLGCTYESDFLKEKVSKTTHKLPVGNITYPGTYTYTVYASDPSGNYKENSSGPKTFEIEHSTTPTPTSTPTPIPLPITVSGSAEVDSSDPLCAGRPSHCALFTIDTGSVNSYASLVIKLPNNLAVMCPTGLPEATKKHLGCTYESGFLKEKVSKTTHKLPVGNITHPGTYTYTVYASDPSGNYEVNSSGPKTFNIY